MAASVCIAIAIPVFLSLPGVRLLVLLRVFGSGCFCLARSFRLLGPLGFAIRVRHVPGFAA